jgi:hypothetical protein
MCVWSALGDGNVLGEGVRFLRHGVALLAGTAGS